MPEFRFEQNEELAARDYVVDQEYDKLGENEHQIWRELCQRQSEVLPNRAARAWYDGMRALEISREGVPNYEAVSDLLEAEFPQLAETTL